jgi:hypothetical protein
MKKVVREETRRRKKTLEVPGLGVVTRSGDAGHLSKAVPVPALGRRCRVALEEYENDPHPEDFHAAIANLLSRDRAVLTAAGRHVLSSGTDSGSPRSARSTDT